MKHISVKMTDADYRRLNSERGDKSISEYVRMILFAHRAEAAKQATEFQQFFRDVTLIREALKEVPTKQNLVNVADYLTEAASIANPPAYAHHQKELKERLQAVALTMKSEE